MKWIKFILPAFWTAYLINDDATGYDDGEVDKIKDFLQKHTAEGNCLYCVGCNSKQRFAPYNDANSLGGDVKIFSFIQITNKKQP